MFSAQVQAAERINYDNIYKNLPVLDIHYDYNEDPDENADYTNYIGSPYPLIRISPKLACRETKLAPGYYLMTIKNRSSYDFVMFKQNGKIAALIPVYEKQLINPETFYPKPEEPKSRFKKTTKAIKNVIAKPFQSHRRPVPPTRTFITSSLVDGGNYFEVLFYQEQYLYKMLFKVEK